MINYKHLHYFFVVAKAGSIARASEQLHLTPQTISGQLSVLEKSLGDQLFTRSGRNLMLTETGRLALSYADEIFSLGGELEQMVRNRPEQRQLVFRVGITDVIPKSIAYRLLEPAFHLPESLRIISREGEMNSLLADLAVHKLDLIIADETIPSHINVRGYNHALGGSGMSFFAKQKVLSQMQGEFPQCLNQAPMLLPGEANALHGSLLKWLDEQYIHPLVVGEFDDSALMKTFGQGGAGVFVAPSAIAQEVQQQYDVELIGQTDEVQERFYSISVERKISHPAIAAINDTAREWLEV